ncbi:MAG: hypothetical protein V7752_00660 [Halopseudomonas sp.]
MSHRYFYLAGLAAVVFLSGCAMPSSPPSYEITLPYGATACPEPRPTEGEMVMCTMNYLPVCAIHSDASRSTQSNDCSACADPKIAGYTDGACP